MCTSCSGWGPQRPVWAPRVNGAWVSKQVCPRQLRSRALLPLQEVPVPGQCPQHSLLLGRYCTQGCLAMLPTRAVLSPLPCHPLLGDVPPKLLMDGYTSLGLLAPTWEGALSPAESQFPAARAQPLHSGWRRHPPCQPVRYTPHFFKLVLLQGSSGVL